jgi:hypothetical protein
MLPIYRRLLILAGIAFIAYTTVMADGLFYPILFELNVNYLRLLGLLFLFVMFCNDRSLYASGLTQDDKDLMAKAALPADAGAVAMLYLAQNGLRAVPADGSRDAIETPLAPTATPVAEKTTYVSPTRDTEKPLWS